MLERLLRCRHRLHDAPHDLVGRYAFGKLGAMLSTVSDIGSNLSVSVDAFLVSAKSISRIFASRRT